MTTTITFQVGGRTLTDITNETGRVLTELDPDYALHQACATDGCPAHPNPWTINTRINESMTEGTGRVVFWMADITATHP